MLRHLPAQPLVLGIMRGLAVAAAVPDRKPELVPAAGAAEVLGRGPQRLLLVDVQRQGGLLADELAEFLLARKLARPEASAHAAVHADRDEARDRDGLDRGRFSLLVFGRKGCLLRADTQAKVVRQAKLLKRRDLELALGHRVSDCQQHHESVVLGFQHAEELDGPRDPFGEFEARLLSDVEHPRSLRDGKHLVQRDARGRGRLDGSAHGRDPHAAGLQKHLLHIRLDALQEVGVLAHHFVVHRVGGGHGLVGGLPWFGFIGAEL